LTWQRSVVRIHSVLPFLFKYLYLPWFHAITPFGKTSAVYSSGQPRLKTAVRSMSARQRHVLIIEPWNLLTPMPFLGEVAMGYLS